MLITSRAIRKILVNFTVVEFFKNCCFLALIFVEGSEKLSEKTACDVNVGQVKKSGKLNSKQSFLSRLGAEVVCAAINVERTGNLSSKAASCGYNLASYYLIFSKNTS